MTASRKPIKNALASWVLYDDSTGKQKEANSLTAVLARLGLGNYQITSSESPDFLVSFKTDNSEDKLACEVTDFFSDIVDNAKNLGSPRKRLFELWKRIAKELRQRLDQAGLENVYGVLFFRDPSPMALNSCRPNQLIKELVKICEKYRGRTEEIVFPVQGFPHLNELLTMLRLFRYPETGILWWCAHLRSGYVDAPEDALLNIIRAKVAKAQSYNWENAVEKWLIIVAEARLLADTATFFNDPKISKHFEGVEFTRIILWDKFRDDVIEIYPAFRMLCDSHAQIRNFDYYPEVLKPYIIRGLHYPTRIRGG